MSACRDLARWLDLLERRHAQTIRLGLDRVQAVSRRLGQTTSADTPVITVGGTNGKGSVCALLEGMLQAGAYRTGVYTSPHFLRFNERIRVDGTPVDDAVIVDALTRVEDARGDVELTYFEHTTLAAWEIFAQAGVDAIILEVGLGGRLDAVNIFDADCAVITGIAMDHQAYLGDTREAVGFEKAGIMRVSRPVVCSDARPPQSVLDHARCTDAELLLIERDFGVVNQGTQWAFWWRHNGHLTTRPGLAYPALRGEKQLSNAAAAMAVLERLRERLPVPMQAVRRGMMEVALPGRFQILPGRPAVVLDVAHNEQAAQVLAQNMLHMGFFPETHAVLGMNADKDVVAVIRALSSRVDHWLLASLPGERGLSAQALAEQVRGIDGEADIACFATPREAFEAARSRASESDRIAVFGSFVTVAEVMHEVQMAGEGVARE